MKRNGLISVIIWCFVSCSFVGRGRFSFLIKQINSTCTCYCVFWPIVIVSQYICLKGLRNHYNSVKSSNHWFNWLINTKLSISLLLKETLVLRSNLILKTNRFSSILAKALMMLQSYKNGHIFSNLILIYF